MRWIQWDDSQSRWCKPHRVIGPVADHMKTACGQGASLVPRGTLGDDVYDPKLGKYRPRTSEEKVWRRTTKEKNGQITIAWSDPTVEPRSGRYPTQQRVRMGEVSGLGPGLCKICNWTLSEEEMDLRRWKAQHIDGMMASKR